MVKHVIRALFVLRLASRAPSLTAAAVLSHWRTRPAIHFVLDQNGETRRHRIKRKLDQVYPF